MQHCMLTTFTSQYVHGELTPLQVCPVDSRLCCITLSLMRNGLVCFVHRNDIYTIGQATIQKTLICGKIVQVFFRSLTGVVTVARLVFKVNVSGSVNYKSIIHSPWVLRVMKLMTQHNTGFAESTDCRKHIDQP